MKKLYEINPDLRGYATDPRTRRYLSPRRIVLTRGGAKDAENLIGKKPCQITLGGGSDLCTLSNGGADSERAAVLLDYGTEICGSCRVMVHGITGDGARVNLRVRFGESVSEALTPLGVKNAGCDHANRDSVINVGFLSANETNESGFRFIYVELLDDDMTVTLKAVQAILIYRDLDYRGSFECSDPEINRIWQTAVYTAHLNMQEYLWDGVKRDRLVWIGDMQTEVMTILSVFGAQDVVTRSMDLVRDETPIGTWMNGISSYSIWWLLLQHDWYMYTGDRDYLGEQRGYMTELLRLLCTYVGEDGAEQLPESRFIDWPNNANEEAKHAGLQSMLVLGLGRGAELMRVLGDDELAQRCDDMSARLMKHVPPCGGSKQAASLMVCAGLGDAKQINRELLSVGGAHGYSTFLGYYTLRAVALAGDYDGALNSMKQYWGGMLGMGATSFWEDFNLDWLENAGRIDEPVPEGKVDIHGDYGAYCYLGFRHSLCHGWASGPAPYLTHTVLGVGITAPGCRKIKIEPQLGSLEYARGVFPTPHGDIFVSHRRDGERVVTEVTLPPQWRELADGEYEYIG